MWGSVRSWAPTPWSPSRFLATPWRWAPRPGRSTTSVRPARNRRSWSLADRPPRLSMLAAMSTATRTGREGFQFDRQQLAALAESKHEAYESATPFPHVVIDEFLPPAVLDGVLAEFPSPRQADWFAFDSPLERKLATREGSAM